MYYANLAEIRLPRISEEVQREFARRGVAILKALDHANAALSVRRTEIEQMVVGTLAVPER